MWALIDDKNIVSVARYEGFLVDMVNEGINQEFSGMAADFAIQEKEVTLPA